MLAADVATPDREPPVISADDLCRSVRERPTGGDSWRMPGLNRILRHDADARLLEIQAGVRWSSLSHIEGAAHFRGTVGQAVAENVAGPDGRPLVSHLRSLTLATADGQLRRASRERSSELFRLAVGGHGAFGPFYSLTLDLDSLAHA
ncbi:MAG TPA: FAD-binding protein, partial [Burkholderiales bacterium]|nr:FAD-binding protein [Burkholderiales bacterium]